MYKINLQLFAEGESMGESMGESSVSPAQENLSEVRYGKQIEDETSEVEESTEEDEKVEEEDRGKLYAEFKSKYKDLYDAEVQGIVKNRLKNAKGSEEKLNALNPVLDMLGKKYGVDASDIDALSKAIEEDDAYYEDEALEKGLTVEQLKEIKKMERENTILKKEMDEQKRRENANRLYSEWMSQAEELKKVYPNFDLNEELKNERFLNLLKTPTIDVKTAFNVIHHDEIMAGFGQKVAEETRKKTADSIKANGSRPLENGTMNSSATVTKSDPSTWTKADREEVSRRVLRGEKIYL